VKEPHNEFLATKESYGDFKLVLNFKLEDDSEERFCEQRAQFRSQGSFQNCSPRTKAPVKTQSLF